MSKASELLEESAGPFDKACLMVRSMEERLAMILGLLNDGFDSEGIEYDLQAVNQAHRIAAGGEMPRRVDILKEDPGADPYEWIVKGDFLIAPDSEFRAFVDSLPQKHWAKYDLSAVRLGWEARKAYID